MRKLNDQELLQQRIIRATKFPQPKWGDHVLRGVRRQTRASFMLGKEALAKAMAGAA